MDFFRVVTREGKKKNSIEIYPEFRVARTTDLMVRGRSFYAVWDEKKGLWSTDEYDVQRLVDEELWDALKQHDSTTATEVTTKFMGNFSSGSWLAFRNYLGHISDSSTQLDERLTFSNTEVKKTDYVSRRLPYPLEAGPIAAYQEMFELLYSPEEFEKLEWAIGSIISGDSVNIQKFFVLYGEGGTGKSTWLNLLQKLMQGYYATFEAKSLASNNGAFSMESFASNPLVAIQHDGDLSKIEDNTKINSIVSHEEMQMNQKYKPAYDVRLNAMLFMGTNKAVRITDSKSGLIRRLIDVRPTGKKHSPEKYHALYSQLDFELGAIAHHCLQRYRQMGKNYYSGYVPVEMMLQTDVFFNFIEAHWEIFHEADGISLANAHTMYKQFCDDALVDFKIPRHRFREELKHYFENFEERAVINNQVYRSWYSGFKGDRFKTQVTPKQHAYSLVMEESVSLLDDMLAECPAQYATDEGTPYHFWSDKERPGKNGKMYKPKPSQVVSTILDDIDTSKLHYVKVPENHIVIDFDLKGDDGEKSLERNLEAASAWPSTYAEHSQGGAGVHLHYIYDGDPGDLARVFDEGIEIKVYSGDASLRRRVSRCNNVPVAHINSGLPLREKKLLDTEKFQSEKGLRALIIRNLRKEIHPGTKPSVDFIHKILDDAYSSGMSYDVTDLRGKIFSFAAKSSNNSLACIKKVQTMQFKSEDVIEAAPVMPQDERLVLYDVEVYPNLFIVCWKYKGAPAESVVRMINPKAKDIEKLLSMKLVGFNVRRYDNHILYGAYMGYNNEQLYQLSQKLINGGPGAYFGEAYNISYADIYDFSSKKQSLKKFQIELGLNHVELALPWDQPVPEELWEKVADYCANDVHTTDQVLDDRMQDLVAREILADLSGLPVNASTQQHTSKIVFGDNRRPQEEFVYTDLSEEFPGYTFDRGQSTYRGEITGEGGYVYAEPGMYKNVALLDIASMHPTTIEQLDLFGPYTKNYIALLKARLAIKRGDYETAKGMLGGKLARHITDEEQAEKLAYALKIVINIVYGLTSARFENAFKDPRNIDNIVAKRGALFMVDLKNAVQARGFTVAHIKTDSIKIPDATPEIIQFVTEFGAKYGYDFEHEATYEKFCLVNDAVYIAKSLPQGKKPAKWTAVGAQFAHPFVYKTMFSGEQVKFSDLCETKTVTTALYLDFDENRPAFLEQGPHFVGKAGRFCPMREGYGGTLLREKDGKMYAAAGTKGYQWLESEMVRANRLEDRIDMSYFENLAHEARETIGNFGDIEQFFD